MVGMDVAHNTNINKNPIPPCVPSRQQSEERDGHASKDRIPDKDGLANRQHEPILIESNVNRFRTQHNRDTPDHGQNDAYEIALSESFVQH
jgi:hypothetical protein